MEQYRSPRGQCGPIAECVVAVCPSKIRRILKQLRNNFQMALEIGRNLDKKPLAQQSEGCAPRTSTFGEDVDITPLRAQARSLLHIQ